MRTDYKHRISKNKAKKFHITKRIHLPKRKTEKKYYDDEISSDILMKKYKISMFTTDETTHLILWFIGLYTRFQRIMII